MEEHIAANFKPEKGLPSKGKLRKKATKLNVVRYADNFIVTGQSPQQLERVKVIINEFLKPRGLKISEAKTRLCNITSGFDFLGWTFRKYSNGTFLCTLSKKSVRHHWRKLKAFIKTTSHPGLMVIKLNRKSRGWQNDHCCCNDIWKVWAKTNWFMYQRLMRWAIKRHSKKARSWVYSKYWPKHKKRRKFTIAHKGTIYRLNPHATRQDRTGTALSIKINVFDLKNKALILQKQTLKGSNLTRRKKFHWEKQKGLCSGCGLLMDPNGQGSLDLHHIKSKVFGGTSASKNLTLLHSHCHYVKHASAS